MKIAIFLLGLAGATLACGGAARAQNYPWCAYYGNGDRGTNCGFVSFQQCLEDVSGIGGFCEPNNLYVPPAARAPRRRHRRQP